jgi:hypothetical protein
VAALTFEKALAGRSVDVVEERMKGTQMSTQVRMGLGSVLSTFGALSVVLSLLLEWPAAPRPWGFLIGFVVGLLVGLGATLSLSGLIERRRGN